MRFLPLTAHSALRIRIASVKVALPRWHYHSSSKFGSGAGNNSVQSRSPCAMWSWPRCADNFADGHTASNTPDLFRPPKLSGAGPG